MRIPFYVMSWFSLAAFKILSFFDFWHLIIMCLCRPLCIQPVWNLLCIMNLDVHFLPQIWVFSTFISLSNISARFSFSSPSGTPLMYILICLMESHMCHRLSSLFFIFFFLFLWLDNLNWFILKFTDYFFLLGQVCCWRSLFNFKFSHCILQFKNIWLVLFYSFCLFTELLILLMYSFPDFVHSYLCSLTVHWVPSGQLFWILTKGQILEFYFCSFVGVMFPWFLLILVTLHYCLYLSRRSHFFESL